METCHGTNPEVRIVAKNIIILVLAAAAVLRAQTDPEFDAYLEGVRANLPVEGNCCTMQPASAVIVTAAAPARPERRSMLIPPCRSEKPYSFT